MSLQGFCGATCSLPSKSLSLVMGFCATLGLASSLPAQVMHADGTGAVAGGVEQASYTSSGSYFSRELGTPLRFGYHSEGYGTESGVVSLGSMKVFNLDGATWFLDGQGTLSDDFGGGFNAGIGYRELVNMSHSLDPDRILGASFWTDGQSTKSDNFFTQLGFSLESLGESFDLRMNGYFPLDRTKTGDPIITDIDTISFQEHGLFAGSQRIVTDTAHSVIDAEAAKRIGNLDAWATAGVYYLGGGGADDTGYKVGLRGYAVPDLLVGVEFFEDDIYDANVMASITWFVGRTHKANAPIGTIVDRFREPVMRNNFISTTSSTAEIAGIELRDDDTDDFFNFLHVDANAAVNGTGTFENPFNTLEAAAAVQQDGSYIYVHSNPAPAPALTPTGSITLENNVKLWGEGTNEFGDAIQHQVGTVERGTVVLPETFPGAQDLDSPTIDVGAGNDFLVLGDNNDVNNFRINGGANIITGNAINAPQLANLDINDPTGIGISFTGITGTAVVDNTVTITNAATGMHIDGGSAGMNVNARITDATGTSLLIENRTGGTIAFGGSIQDGAADTDTAAAIIIQNNNDAIIDFTQIIDTSEDPDLGINIDSGNFNALQIAGNDDGTEIEFADLIATAADADTISFADDGSLVINATTDDSSIANTGTGDAFHYSGGAAEITVAADINNSGGGNAVEILGHTENDITFSGEVSDSASAGIVLDNNANGTIAFSDQVSIANSTNGVTITNGADDVTYSFADIDIQVTTGTGFSVTGDGTLIVTSADGENLVRSNMGSAIVLDGLTNGLTIGTGGAIFDEVEVVNGAADLNGVVLRDLDGEQVRIGPTSPSTISGGTIAVTGTGTGIVVDDVANASINNVNINKAGTGQGMLVIDQEDGAIVATRGVEITAADAARGLVVGTAAGPNQDGNTATFTELVVNSVNGDAVAVEENDGGTYIFNDLTAATSGSGDAVHIADNSDDTVVTFNDMDLAATDTGRGFFAQNGGEIVATGDTTVDTNTGAGVFIDDVTIGSAGAQFDTVNVTNAATDAISNPTGSAVLVRQTAGTGLVTIGSGNNPGDGGTVKSSGDAILIDNANNVAITRVTVDNDDINGNGLVIQNQDGGNVSVTGLTARTVDGTGIVAQNNTGGTNVFNTTDIDVTGTGNGVTLSSNTGATNTFNGLTINTTSGTGFAASGGGIVAATGINTVTTTTTGTGVDMNGTEIGAAGFSLNSVNVNGAINGVVLTNLTGTGTFRQGAATATGTDGAGGTLSTTGDSIVLSGVTNAVFNDVTANSENGRAAFVTHTITTQATIIFDNLATDTISTSGNGVELVDSGTGELDFTLRNSTVNAEDSDTVAFLFTAGTNSGEVDIRLQNNTELATDANSAVSAVVSTGSGNIQFLMTANTISNNSGAGGAAQFNLDAGRNLNLTVGGEGGPGNTFSNNGAGSGFVAQTLNTTSGRINLDLRDNTSIAGSVNKYQLTNVATADFGVVDRDDTISGANNTGTVNATGTFLDISSVLQPD